MQGLVKWLGTGAHFQGITSEGLSFELAGPPQLNNGVQLAPKPIDILMHAAAACTSVDIVTMLKERGAELTFYEVKIEAERGAEAPKPIEKMNLHYVIKGNGLNRELVSEVIDIAFKVESGVVNTFKTAVTWSFEL